jgi:hypothetical protein
MRATIFATLAVAGLALTLTSCAPKPPKEYDNAAWNFGAAFPGEPKPTDIPAKADGSSPHEFRVEMTESGHDFTVQATDATGSNQTDAQVLEHAPQVIADGFGGALSSEIDVTSGQIPGKEFHIDRDQQATLVVRIFSVGNRMYQVAAQSEKGAKDPAAIAFLNSFHLLTPPPPPAPPAPVNATNAANSMDAGNAAAPASNATN